MENNEEIIRDMENAGEEDFFDDAVTDDESAIVHGGITEEIEGVFEENAADEAVEPEAEAIEPQAGTIDPESEAAEPETPEEDVDELLENVPDEGEVILTSAEPAENERILREAAAANAAAEAAVPQNNVPESWEQTVPPEKPKKKKGKKVLIGLVVFLCILAALCGGYAYLCNKGDTTSIDTQYYINDVNITGMTRDEAEKAIQTKFETDYADSEYEVQVDEVSYKIPVVPYLSIDASTEIGRALSYDPGPWIGRGLKYIQSLISSVDSIDYSVEPALGDKDGLLKAAQKVAETVFEAPEDATWKEENGIISITVGDSGRSIDPEKICEDIAAGIEEGNYSGTVTAEVKVSAPKEVNAEEIAAAMYLAPKDASYQLVDNEIKVEPSVDGREVSIDAIKNAIASAKEGTTVTVETTPVKPAVSAEDLNGKLLADRLSGYAVVDGGSWSQINNQTIACDAVNGTIVMPGEIFSFNEVVGDTTEEKGYVEDYAYENNKLVKQFGGGVCRVASTLYAAVLYTDLEVVERYNHTSPVHYLPYGMDATVSYPEPDLQFRNNRKYPIMVEMYVGDDGYVHSGIYGTKEENEPYIDVELDFINDMLVDTYRNYYTEEGGELLFQEYMHTSSYRDLEPEETSGTAAPQPAATPETTVTPEATPEVTPEATPEATPEPTPEATPEPEEESSESSEDGGAEDSSEEAGEGEEGGE